MNFAEVPSEGAAADSQSRANITWEAQRKTAGPEAIAQYAAENPAINIAKTHLNVDRVNDGEGGWRETKSIAEVVAYGDERVSRMSSAPKAGNRVALTTVGQLPWAYCEPDGTEYQAVDEIGDPKVYTDGPNAGKPVMLPRYRIREDRREEAMRYFDDWLEYQASILPGGQAAMHGYSINLDESRPHIQLLSDPFEDYPSKKNPDALKSGYSRAFGRHPKDQLVPELDKAGQPVLRDDGEPKLVKDNQRTKMARYQAELRAFMVARGHSVALERDEARHDRHLGLQDYKDLEHSRREVADTAEHLDIEMATVADERAHYDDASIVAVQEAVEAELGEVMAQSQAAERALAAERQQWEQTEKPRLEKTVTAEAKRVAAAEWETNEKPVLEKEARAEATTALDESLLDTLVDLEATNRALRGSDVSPDQIRDRLRDRLQPGGVPRRIEVVAGLAKAAADDRQAEIDAKWEAVRAYDRGAVDKAASAEFVRQSKNVRTDDGRTAYEAIHDKIETSFKTMHPEHKKGLTLKQFATETIRERQERRTAGAKRTHAAIQERNQTNAAKRAANPDSQRPKPQGQ